MRKALALSLIAVPALYYFALIAGAATYPGYSYMMNYASDLGAANAPYPWLFNVSIMIGGVAAIMAAVLLPKGLRNIGANRFWSIAAAIGLALWGIAMFMAGMFPLPDDRHGGYGLGFVGPLIPLCVLLALRAVEHSRGMQIFLAIVFVASTVMLAIMFGIGELVTRANVGLYQRLNTGASIPWFAVLGAWLLIRDRPTRGG